MSAFHFYIHYQNCRPLSISFLPRYSFKCWVNKFKELFPFIGSYGWKLDFLIYSGGYANHQPVLCCRSINPPGWWYLLCPKFFLSMFIYLFRKLNVYLEMVQHRRFSLYPLIINKALQAFELRVARHSQNRLSSGLVQWKDIQTNYKKGQAGVVNVAYRLPLSWKLCAKKNSRVVGFASEIKDILGEALGWQ